MFRSFIRTMSTMPIRAPARKHWIHRRTKLKKMIRKIRPMTSRNTTRMATQLSVSSSMGSLAKSGSMTWFLSASGGRHPPARWLGQLYVFEVVDVRLVHGADHDLAGAHVHA